MNNEPFNFNAEAPSYYPGMPYKVKHESYNVAEDAQSEGDGNLVLPNEGSPSEGVLSQSVGGSVDSAEYEEKDVDEVESRIEKMTLSCEEVKEDALEESISEKKSNLVDVDPRHHLNIIFIGHVDAGKSTACGNILYILGYVDDRTIEKYEREAKEKNRESWFLAFIMDINEEERQKGKTVEVGRAHFETKDRRFTILDAPGHKNFIPNMISGAAQADIGVLIISARKGEFETGFERGGQTREHTLLARTLGINQLIVAINKMDDPTCNWSESRYEEIQKKITPFIKSCGYNLNKDVYFVPISGLTGQNLSEHVSDKNAKVYDPRASWYDTSKPTLFQILNTLPPPPWDENGPLRIPLLEGYKDNGIIAVGKIESGTIYGNNMNCTLMPNKVKVKVLNVYLEEDEVPYAKPGENVRIKLLGVDEDQISKGFVLCDSINVCSVVSEFVGRVAIVELLEHKPIITAGYFCIFHAHTTCEEIQFLDMLEVIDKKSKKKIIKPKFIKSDCIVTAHFLLSNPVCVEVYDKLPQLGRFTLRDQGKTIAIGKILELKL